MANTKLSAGADLTNGSTIHSLPIPSPGSRAERRRNYLKKFDPAGLPQSGRQSGRMDGHSTPLPATEHVEDVGAKVAAQTYISPSEVSDLALPVLSVVIVRAEPMIKASKAKEGSLRCAVPVVYANGHWISRPGVDWIRASGQPASTVNSGRNELSQWNRGKPLTPAQLSVRANLSAHDASITARKAAERRSYDEKEGLSPAARKAAENRLAEAMEWYERRCKRLARETAEKQLKEAMEWFDRRVERFERAYVGPWPARARELAPGVVEVVGERCVCSVEELVGGVGCGRGGCEV
jgi:hypothetical protein